MRPARPATAISPEALQTHTRPAPKVSAGEDEEKEKTESISSKSIKCNWYCHGLRGDRGGGYIQKNQFDALFKFLRDR